MKKTKINWQKFRYKVLPVVLIIIFASIITTFYLQNYYSSKLFEYNQTAFPTGESGGFTLFNNKKMVDPSLAPIRKGTSIALKPGGEFKGSLGLKNHDDFIHTFKILTNLFEKKNLEKYKIQLEEETENEELDNNEDLTFHGNPIEHTDDVYDINSGKKMEDQKQELVLPQLEILGQEKDTFIVDAEDVIFLDYKVSVPEDIEPGFYQTVVKATVIDETAQKIMIQEGVVMDVAVGVVINIFVDDNPEHFEYNFLNAQTKELAYQATIIKLRFILGILFAFLTLYFLFMAYYISPKKIKK